jgi:hypothetical protein
MRYRPPEELEAHTLRLLARYQQRESMRALLPEIKVLPLGQRAAFFDEAIRFIEQGLGITSAVLADPTSTEVERQSALLARQTQERTITLWQAVRG